MYANPLFSVVVLNHNKKEKVLRCLESVLKLSWRPIEILCVDNASQDGSPEAIRTRFGESVRIIERTENSVTQARNQGFLAARGVYILSLDNDMLLPDSNLLEKGHSLFTEHERVGILTAKVASPEEPDQFQSEHWWHPFERETHQDRLFLTDYFPEAAVFLRRSAIEETGGYDEAYFMGFEQADLSIRMARIGWKILYSPSLVCIEDDTRAEFVSKRHPIHYYNIRNKLWTAWKHYPLFEAIGFGAARSGVSLFRGFRHGYPDLILKGIFHGLFPPETIRRQRSPLNSKERERVRSARKGEVLHP